jgi:hypothetical protein
MSNTSKTVVAFPFMPLLALMFIGLKLAGYITWSWVWVLSPLWIPLAIALCILVLVAAITWARS